MSATTTTTENNGPSTSANTTEPICTQFRSHGHSTPVSGHPPQPFVPSDISSVASSSSAGINLRKRSRHRLVPDIPQESSTPLTSSDGVSKQPTDLECVEAGVSSRFPLLGSSFSEVLSNIQSSPAKYTDDSSDFSDEPVTVRKRKAAPKGQDWKLFKPKYKETLYNTILTSSDPLEEATRWVHTFAKNPRKAITDIMQFLIDVCGYQELDVSRIFQFREANHLQVIHFMESNPPEYQEETGKYLLKTYSKWGKETQNIICEFMKHIVEISHDQEVICDPYMAHLFGFIVSLSASYIKSLLHTGIVVAIKMATALYKIHMDLIKKINYLLLISRLDVTDRLEVLKTQKASIQKILSLFQNAIEKGCCYDDSDLNNMKVLLITEMQKWFTINPSIIASTGYLRKLMKLVQDRSNVVRLAALKTCHKLVETNNFKEHLKPAMKKFVSVVVGRIYDIDYPVAVAAIEICTTLISTYPKSIDRQTRNSIILFVYNKHALLAMAGGKFLVKYFYSFLDVENRVDPTVVIKQLIDFVNRPKMQRYSPLLVESILDSCPEISNWRIMINLLLSETLDHESEETLVIIMCQAIQYTVTGKPKYLRIKFHRRPVNPENVTEIADIFIDKLPVMLKKYVENSKAFQILLETFLTVDMENIVVGRYVNKIDNLIPILRPAFVRNTDCKVLEAISNVFSMLCEEKFLLKNRFTSKVLTLKQAVGDAVTNFIDLVNADEPLSEESLQTLELCLLRLSILFMNHDMTGAIESNTLFNDLISLSETNLTSNSMQYIIKCGYWFLTWELQFIIENCSQFKPNNVLDEHINQLKHDCDLFMEKCFESLTNSTNMPTCNTAFECICDLHNKFRETLDNPKKSKPKLEELIPVMDQTQISSLLGYAEALLFGDNSDNRETLRLRRISLGKVIDLSLNNVIRFTNLIQICVYYESHAEDYEDIFNNYFKIVGETDCGILSAMLVRVLMYLYTRLFLETNTISVQSEEADDLRKLAKKFQLYISKSSVEAILVIHFGVKCALVKETQYQFLDFIKYFVLSLSPNEVKEIISFIRTRLSPEQAKNPTIESFISYLQNKKLEKQQAKRQSIADTTTSSEIPEEQIEEATSNVSTNEFEELTIEDDSDL